LARDFPAYESQPAHEAALACAGSMCGLGWYWLGPTARNDQPVVRNSEPVGRNPDLMKYLPVSQYKRLCMLIGREKHLPYNPAMKHFYGNLSGFSLESHRNGVLGGSFRAFSRQKTASLRPMIL
jgi:hypothetical protein